MRLCLVGPGAVGGYVGALLGAHCSGAEQHRLGKKGSPLTLTVVARGARLASLKRDGLRCAIPGRELVVAHAGPRVAFIPPEGASEAGEQDVVILTLKAHTVGGAMANLGPLLGPGTKVVACQNGVPFWHFYGLPGAWEGHQIAASDPRGEAWREIGPERAVGAVIHVSCSVREDGVVECASSSPDQQRLVLGMPDGSDPPPFLQELVGVLGAAGLVAEAVADVRSVLWTKLMGNASFNPVSAMTGATMSQIFSDPSVIDLVRRIQHEVVAVAESVGVTVGMAVDERIAFSAPGPGRDVNFKTSMLQDLESGRTLETGALVGAVKEIGAISGVPTPSTDLVLGILAVQERARAGVGGSGCGGLVPYALYVHDM